MKQAYLKRAVALALLTAASSSTMAEWQPTDGLLTLSNSRPVFDRTNRVYSVAVTLENNTETPLQGPFRLIIEDPTLPVVNASGLTQTDESYFELALDTLAVAESHTIKVNFELQRKPLTFTPRVEQDVPAEPTPQVTVRVEAEDYVDYFDTSPGDNGNAGNGDDVDIENAGDEGGGKNIAWTAVGEWLDYDVELQPGHYQLTARVASAASSGAFDLLLNGAVVGDSSVASTGGWQLYETVELGYAEVTESGVQRVRVAFTGNDVNLNWLEFVPVDADQIPDESEPGSGDETGGSDPGSDGNSGSDTPFGIEADSDGNVTLFASDADWAVAHFIINGGGQQNVGMSAANGRLEFVVADLNNGDTVDYSITYAPTGAGALDSPWQSFVVSGVTAEPDPVDPDPVDPDPVDPDPVDPDPVDPDPVDPDPVDPDPVDPDPVDPDSPWSLVWSDEFNGSEIDLNKWEHEVNCTGGGNNERQCYTSSPDNSFVDNGLLKIVAKQATGLSQPFTSARLRTKYQGDWTYGRIEVKARPPEGQGSFPAIWMLPTDNVYGGWPHSGEIDIFESVNLKVEDGAGNVEHKVHGNAWYGRSAPNQSNTGAEYELPGAVNPADDFHVYAIEWEEGEIRWYVDNILYQTQRQSELRYDSDGDAVGLVHQGWFTQDRTSGELLWNSAPYDQRFHLLLNFAVGGNWAENVNNKGIDASAFNESNPFEIDYVRVYECSLDPVTGKGCATTTPDYDQPKDEGGTLVKGKAPTPVKPSSGIASDLIVFEDELNASWPAWNCCAELEAQVVTDEDEAHDQVVEFSIDATPTVVGFNTRLAETPELYDGLPMKENGVLEFDLKLVNPPTTATTWYLKVEQADANSEASVVIDAPTSDWSHYSIPLKALSSRGLDLNGIDVILIFPAWGTGDGAQFRVDNLRIVEGEPVDNNGPETGVELLTNGDFENGTEGWGDSATLVSDGDNHYFQADVAVAGNPWDVNLGQVIEVIQGATYRVTFKAKASTELQIGAGIGLNHEPWTNITETLALTTEWATYSYDYTAADFGDIDSRVLFDLGAEVGIVSLDEISVVLIDAGSGNAPVAEDEYALLSSTGASDIDFAPDTVGEWSTGTVINSDISYDGLGAWELTSGSNTPEQGNWGTVLAFQNGILGDFSQHNKITLKLATFGGYSRYMLYISANGVAHEVQLPVSDAEFGWQSITLETAKIPLNLSSIDSVVVYGVGGTPGVSTIYLTDLKLIKDQSQQLNDTVKEEFVFIAAQPGQATNLIVDGDNESDVGNVIFGEWSTGTVINSVYQDELEAIELVANGGWGAVLALQGDISDGEHIDNYDTDFSQYTNLRLKVQSVGEFEKYAVSIVSTVGGHDVAQEVPFTLSEPGQWNSIDIDLNKWSVNLSQVSQIAVFGVYAGGSNAQRLYISDMVMYDSGIVGLSKPSDDDKFVFFSSTGEATDLVFDGNEQAHDGNIEFSDWSTGSTFSEGNSYLGLPTFEVRHGGGWGAVLALMGDIYGDVQEYKLDVAAYSTINLKIAANGNFGSYLINFIVDGAEHQVALDVTSEWQDFTIHIDELPINASKIKQIAIYGIGGAAGDQIYIADLNITK